MSVVCILTNAVVYKTSGYDLNGKFELIVMANNVHFVRLLFEILKTKITQSILPYWNQITLCIDSKLVFHFHFIILSFFNTNFLFISLYCCEECFIKKNKQSILFKAKELIFVKAKQSQKLFKIKTLLLKIWRHHCTYNELLILQREYYVNLSL